MEKTQVKFNQETQSHTSSGRGTALDLSSDWGVGARTMVQPFLASMPLPLAQSSAFLPPSYPLATWDQEGGVEP